MIPLEEARAKVLAACTPRPATLVGLKGALGLVLAEAVTAADPVPPFDNSAMDGYAVRSADVASASPESPIRLKVTATIAAGQAPTSAVGPGEAVRIMTGAPFPEGADAVVVVERARPDEGGVWVESPVAAGAHVRRAGEDVSPGQEVFEAGTELGPGHLGVLASIGREKVAVVPAPSVGVLSTGDELVEGGGELKPGQIRDSNRLTLLALLQRDGFEAVDLGIAADDEKELEQRLGEGVERCQAVLTSGGVSMGDFDMVKVVLDRLGHMSWMQVSISPAKPFAFGTVGSTPVFGLPGNPVSSMVSYELLARPGLRKIAGHPEGALVRPTVPAVATSELRPSRDGRTLYVRVRAEMGEDGRYRVASTGGQGSHQLHAMALANALAVVPPGVTIPEGGRVEALLL